jgi:hypothetical protein
MGGLGNQLFQYAYALRQSRENSSKVFLNPNLAVVRTDELGNPEISKYLLDSKVIIEPSITEPKIIKKFIGTGLRLSNLQNRYKSFFLSKCFSLVNRVLLSIYFQENVKMFFSRNTGYWFSKVENRSSLSVGYFQSHRYSDHKEDLDVLRELVPLNINPEQQSLLRSAEIESPLVVHVRLADYRMENSFGIPSQNYYQSAIVSQFHSGLYKKIWLFSDEPDEAINFIPEDYLDKVRNISQTIKDPIWTLEAMRLGKGYVIANSTFSWWGAYLSHTKEPVVVYPKPWFQGMPDPIDICPPSWRPFPR